jgi:hypothetical protein
MSAPTIAAYSNSSATDTGGTFEEVTGSVNWTNGDLVIVLGVIEDNGAKPLNTPTASGTGLTFSAISGFPSNVASACKIYGWQATASATSSGTITCTRGAGSGDRGVIAVWVLSGHNGIGNVAVSSATDTSNPYTVSLTRAGNNSAVLLVAGDWNATSDTTTGPSPATGGSQRLGNNGGLFSTIYNGYVMEWADEGASGTTSYGVSMDVAGGIFTLGAVEVKAAAVSGSTFTPAQGALSLAGLGTSLGFAINMPDEI